MLNETFAAEATAAFNATPAHGPYTLAMSSSSIWVPLPNISVTYSTIIDDIRHLANASDPSSLHLPPAYGLEPTLVAGYRAQLLALADLLANPRSPSLESAFATGTYASAVLLHPLSRGTARLNLTRTAIQNIPNPNPQRRTVKLTSTDPFEPPILDYRSSSNPIDLSLHILHTRYLRRMVHTPSMQALGAVEVDPGDARQTDAELEAFVRQAAIQSFMHPCCTAAMLPRARGGVVGSDLKVHGAEGLRVVDMSVLPMLPGAHLSWTAYAVGEKVSFEELFLRAKGRVQGRCRPFLFPFLFSFFFPLLFVFILL